MAHKRQLYHPRQDKSKHLLQIEQGGLGTDSLSEAADNFGLLKNKDLDIPNGAAVVGVTGMITKDRIEGGEILPEVPIVNGPTMVRAGEPYEYVISNYDSFTEYNLTSRNGTAVLSGDKIIFTGEYPGDASFTLNEVKYPITIGNLDIGQPAILSPVNGSIRIEIDFTFKSSSFSSSGAADTHRSSDWQISKTADFSDIAKESYQDPINLTEWAIEGLEYEKKYYVRTRHYGAAPGPGPWSNVVEFTTRPEAYVLEPQIQYPSYGEQDVSRLPTLITSPLYVFKGTDLHVSTDWEISSNDIFTNLIASSQDDQVNKTAWAPPRLPNDSTLYLRARHKGAVLDKGDWSLTTMFKTVNVVFHNPSITSPTENATTPTVTVTVTGSIFTVTGEVDNHVSTDWQISKNSSFSPVLYASENDTVNKTSWTPPKLESNTTYYVRARYLSGLNGYSGWTPTRAFKSATVTIAAPSVINPANGTMDASTEPTITSSVFSITGDSDTHLASDWQISTSSDFSTIAYSSIDDTVNKTSWTPSESLNSEVVYYVRVRHKGEVYGYGPWSQVRAFKTKFSRKLNISPAFNGKTTWDLETDGPLDILGAGSARRFAITVDKDVEVEFKAWGGGGSSLVPAAYPDYGGGGAYVGCKTTLKPGITYTVCAASTASSFAWADIGGAPGNNADHPDTRAGGGGGLSGLFKSSISPSGAIAIAGGGGGGFGFVGPVGPGGLMQTHASFGGPGRGQVTTVSTSLNSGDTTTTAWGCSGGGGGFSGGSPGILRHHYSGFGGDAVSYWSYSDSTGGTSYVDAALCTNISIVPGSGRVPGNAGESGGYGYGGSGYGSGWTPGRAILR